MTDRMDQAGEPLSDELEMDLRGRVTLLEQRLALAFWLAVAAEVGVIALATIIAIAAWKGKE